VLCRYVGRLKSNGRVFDKTDKKPFAFRLGESQGLHTICLCNLVCSCFFSTHPCKCTTCNEHVSLVCELATCCIGTWLSAVLLLTDADAGKAKMCPVLLCCAVLCCAVLCCAVLCCAVLCCAVLCCAVLCAGVGDVIKGWDRGVEVRARNGTPPSCTSLTATWVCSWCLE
jgi:hypothetical protein